MMANLLQRCASGSQQLLQRLCSKVQLVMCSPKPRAAMESRKCRKSFGWDRGWLLYNWDNNISYSAEKLPASKTVLEFGRRQWSFVRWSYCCSSSFSGANVTRHSVVNNNPAME